MNRPGTSPELSAGKLPGRGFGVEGLRVLGFRVVEGFGIGGLAFEGLQYLGFSGLGL